MVPPHPPPPKKKKKKKQGQVTLSSPGNILRQHMTNLTILFKCFVDHPMVTFKGHCILACNSAEVVCQFVKPDSFLSIWGLLRSDLSLHSVDSIEKKWILPWWLSLTGHQLVSGSVRLDHFILEGLGTGGTLEYFPDNLGWSEWGLIVSTSQR